MGNMKVVVDDHVEKRFRRVAMMRYGYGKGALSSAAEAALDEWSTREDLDAAEPVGMEDPVGAIEGLLKHVEANSVELQHEAVGIRARRASAKSSG
jgi:hypothetical protein